MDRKNVHLWIIDPQNDFCDPRRGALFVTGADDDMHRLAGLIRRIGPQIRSVHVTLDSHHPVHVAHPIYWQDAHGRNPEPLTIITAKDVREGRWLPTRREWLHRTREGFGVLNYVEALEAHGKYPLCIWPPHCLIGTWGHNIFPPLLEALHEWQQQHISTVNFVTKGSHPHTEHYSAICADVPDPTDPSTATNWPLLQKLMEADEILLAGEAASHCLTHTALDADACFPDGSFARKLVLLADAASLISGFEEPYERFVSKLSARGMRVMTTEEYAAAHAI